MTNHSTALVQELWNYCSILRDDGHEESMKEEESPVVLKDHDWPS